ncbi:MAG: hypothetical protein KJP06_04625 [Deltaproteobacteria bacterium]|nr:hypothetical protein [Deltaproteobacteria bacterium]
MTEAHLTGRIFSHMLLEFFAPQGLKSMAAAVQGVEFGAISPLAAQIAPLDLRGFHTRVMFYIIAQFCLNYLLVWNRFYDFIFYKTGLTGFNGYFLAFRMKAKNFNRLRRENIHIIVKVNSVI